MIPVFDAAACVATGWHLTPDLALRGMLVAGLLLVAGRVGAKRVFAGQRLFVGLLAAMVTWLVLTAVERAAGDAACKATLAMLAWPVIATIPLLWAVFLLRYQRSDHRPWPRWRSAALAAPVLLFGAASLANGSHGLLYGEATRAGDPVFGVAAMHYDHGVLFWLQVSWCYALLLVCTLLVLRALASSHGLERRHWLGFLVMTLIPWASNAAYLGFGIRVFGDDPTPLAFGTAVAGMAWLIGSSALFEVVPMARELLFTELPDPVLVIDTGGRVMEANAAAQALAGAATPRGTPLAQWPRFGAAAAAQLSQRGIASTLLPLDGGARVYEMRTRPIGDAPRQIGTLIQLRDVTEQQRVQQRIVQTLAERNAQLVRVAALQRELREQALRDPLTGLYNRRALIERYAGERSHQRATGQPLALAVIDVDHFKRINDGHGHAMGDRVLCAVAAAMAGGLRLTDTVFRTGGEEFVLLLPGADIDHAARRVEALRRSVADVDVGLPGVRITVSAGVAAPVAGDDGLDSLLQAADRALYRAKTAGRDRVVVAAG